MNINYINFDNTTTFHGGKVPYFTFKNLEKLDFLRHGFSTRLGGVSNGVFSSMNLNFTRGDDRASVEQNFRLIGEALGINPEDMVYARQTHTTNVMEAGYEHRGMGVTKERSFDDIDGFVTNKPGVALVTTYADCVPVFLADPVRKAIGLAHSGWRGTVKNITKETVRMMVSLYGCKPSDMVAFVGPSICRGCYEVGADVAKEFAAAYGEMVFDGILYPADSNNPDGEKYRIDLHRANEANLLNAGLKQENISITDVCTCCNPGLFFSHRASKGRRGGLCGFLQIK